jgi:hypothetical protein
LLRLQRPGREELEVLGDDDDAAPLAAVVTLPGAAVEVALGVEQAALAEILARQPGELAERNQVVVNVDKSSPVSGQAPMTQPVAAVGESRRDPGALAPTQGRSTIPTQRWAAVGVP